MPFLQPNQQRQSTEGKSYKRQKTDSIPLLMNLKQRKFGACDGRMNRMKQAVMAILESVMNALKHTYRQYMLVNMKQHEPNSAILLYCILISANIRMEYHADGDLAVAC